MKKEQEAKHLTSRSHGRISHLIARAKSRLWGPSLEARFDTIKNAYQDNPSFELADALQQMIGTTSSAAEVLSSMVEFDEKFYSERYPDVKSSNFSAYFHYLRWGWKESRAPSAFFDSIYYRDLYPDLDIEEFPLAHYCKYSKPRGISGHPISGERWLSPSSPDDLEWGCVQPALFETDTKAAVIVPVYRGYNDTLFAIYSALRSRIGEKYALVVVNDCSPEPHLADKLQWLAERGLFHYYVTPSNKGFVKTVNWAIEALTKRSDVVLLNSDAYVFPGWFGRMIAHAEADPTIATITPLSNNATICSYPLYDQDNFHSLELSADEIDQVAALENRGMRIDAPTGVGFCFYIRRSALEKIGLFDEEAFPTGYGEENDFCMRAMHAGFKNVVAGDVFVYHTGSVSFSSAKTENYSKGQYNLSLKHPNYSELVRHHVDADPERLLRRNIDRSRAIRALKSAVVVITHNWGGGVETYVRERSSELRAEGKAVIILRLHDRHNATLEDSQLGGLFVPNLKDLDLRIDIAFLFKFLEDLEPSSYQVNSLVGLEWNYQKKILQWLINVKAPKVFVGHDFSPLSHNYQLLRPDNVFVGIPQLRQLRDWNDMRGKISCFDACDPLERHQVYSSFFNSGVNVAVPSNSTQAIYSSIFPDAAISVIPHRDHMPPMPMAVRAGRARLCVAVVGAIGQHKGSDLLLALARDAKNRNLPIDFHLIGYSNNDNSLIENGVKVWGRYRSVDDASRLLDQVQPDLAFIPSIWPETFCYALSIVLAKKIPTAVFDLGAQAERLSDLPWGIVLPLELMVQIQSLSDTLLSLPLNDLWEERI